MCETSLKRRSLLRSAVAGSLIFPGIIEQLLADSGDPLAPRTSHFPPRAKNVIFLFMTGGVSHVDTFDPKPALRRDHGKEIKADHPEIKDRPGYERIYPDGGTFPHFENKPALELLGPSSSTLEELFESAVLNPNHLSIITRLNYGQFSIVIASDAQMENWDHFDREGLLEKKCDVLRAAHHGSKRGSQWERLERLSPSLVVVSSDPDGQHHLPDVVGGVIFLEFEKGADRVVALTHDTGTIKIEVPDPNSHARIISAFGEGPDDDVFPGQPVALTQTDWAALVNSRLH